MGTPLVILAAGQDNVYHTVTQTWAPNPRVKVWNNIVNSESSGTAFITPPSNTVGLPLAYASMVADAFPDKDIYLITLARNGSDMLTWVGGGTWNVGPVGNSNITFNSSAATAVTQVTVNSLDVNGVRRPSYLSGVGSKIYIKQGSNTWVYNVTGKSVNITNGVYTVTYESGPTSSPTGTVMFEASPRFITMLDMVVPTALASLNKATIDTMLWWHGHHDAQYNTNYSGEFNFLIDYLTTSRPWFSTVPKIILCTVAPTSVTGSSYSDSMNTRLSNLVTASPERRYFANFTSNVSSSRWTAQGLAMTGQGYLDAATYLVGSVYAGPPPTPQITASSIKIRNAAGTGWLDASMVTSFKVRNSAGTGWLDKTGTLNGVLIKGPDGNWYKK